MSDSKDKGKLKQHAKNLSLSVDFNVAKSNSLPTESKLSETSEAEHVMRDAIALKSRFGYLKDQISDGIRSQRVDYISMAHYSGYVMM
jgi:hypothetical protein